MTAPAVPKPKLHKINTHTRSATLPVFLLARHFALRFAQHPRVMLGMLQECLLGHPVIRQLRIAGERQVLVDDLLGCAAHLAFWARAVKDPVDDVAERALPVRFGPRTGFR